MQVHFIPPPHTLVLHCASDPKGYKCSLSGSLTISKTMEICQKQNNSVCTQIQEKTEQDKTSGAHTDHQCPVVLVDIYLFFNAQLKPPHGNLASGFLLGQ